MSYRLMALPGTTSSPSSASRFSPCSAFQVADIYQVQAFRGHEKQYMRLASAWSVVFLIAIGISFFAKAGDQFSRAWLGAFYVLGLFALIAFRRGLFLLVRRWTQEGRLDRRTVVVGRDTKGETLIRSLRAQRDFDVRLIGAFDDRNYERTAAVEYRPVHHRAARARSPSSSRRRTMSMAVLLVICVGARVRSIARLLHS